MYNRPRERRTWIGDRCGLACLVALLAVCTVHALHAEEPPVPAQADKETVTPESYGKTPEAAIPYRDFTDPYIRFFDKVIPFRGIGRDKLPAVPPASVRIGFMGPTGNAPDADLGQQMMDGVNLAFEQANSQGGYEGIPLELIVRPDVGLWGATSNEMAAFRFEDDALAVIGSIDGANTHIALRVALKTETVMINTGDTDPTLTETNLPWIVRVIADDRQQGYALAHHIFQELGIDRVAALRVNNRYGRVGIAEFRDLARRLKRPLRVELRWNPGSREFFKQLGRIAEVNAGAVILWGSAQDCAAAVRAIRQWNVDNPDNPVPERIFGCDRMASDVFLKAAGAAGEGVVAAATFDPTQNNPRYITFRQQFLERFGHAPDAYAAHAYDGANLLVNAIRHAGLNRVLVRDYLFEQKRYDGVTGTVEFDATLNDVGPVFLATVKGGALQFRRAEFSRMTGRQNAPTPYRAMADAPPGIRTPDRKATKLSGPVRIGCFVPMDQRGQAVVEGIRLAVKTESEAAPLDNRIELLVHDANGPWSVGTTRLVDMVTKDEVLAVIGSTERAGTHLIETLAAKLHFPLIALCASDSTINQIPLPWIFNMGMRKPAVTHASWQRFADLVGPERAPDAAIGYDAATVLIGLIRSGATDRRTLAQRLREIDRFRGATGDFRFDGLGKRLDLPDDDQKKSLDTDNSTNVGYSIKFGSQG